MGTCILYTRIAKRVNLVRNNVARKFMVYTIFVVQSLTMHCLGPLLTVPLQAVVPTCDHYDLSRMDGVSEVT